MHDVRIVERVWGEADVTIEEDQAEQHPCHAEQPGDAGEHVHGEDHEWLNH